MKGVAPVRRTLQYLTRDPLHLKDRVQVFALHYNFVGDNHQGARDFAFWNISQLQFNNPNVQITWMLSRTPSPFIRIFCNNGEEILIDVDGKDRSSIYEHVKKVICKTKADREAEDTKEGIQDNPAHFGWGCKRHCICEEFGQLPCPILVNLPKVMRRKFITNFDVAYTEDIDEDEF